MAATPATQPSGEQCARVCPQSPPIVKLVLATARFVAPRLPTASRRPRRSARAGLRTSPDSVRTLRTDPRLAWLATSLFGCAGTPTLPEALPDLGPTCLRALDAATSYPDPNCQIAQPLAPDTFDEVLAKAGLNRCQLGYSEKDWSLFGPELRSDLWRLPWYDSVHNHAMRAPAFGRALIAELDLATASKQPVADALMVAAASLGVTIAPCLPLPRDTETPLADVIAMLTSEKADRLALVAATRAIPHDLQVAIGDVITAAGEANRAWATAITGFSDDDLSALSTLSALLFAEHFSAPVLTDEAVKSLLSSRLDLRPIIEGAVRLAYAIERADLRRFAGIKGFALDQPTPLGRIVIRDAANDQYEDDPDHPILLLLDTGGNDTYRFPAGAIDASDDPAALRHVSVAIDLAGSDDYGYVAAPDPQDGKRLPSDGGGRYHPFTPFSKYGGPVSLSETPRQGAARLGIGLLFDLGSEGDHYHSLRMSQGFGLLGVGVLYDAGGDDLYEGEAGVQGGGFFGIGLLLDGSGDDRYRTYTFSQGFGYIRGVGMLYDRSGADQYFADSGDPGVGGDALYVSPQLPCDSPNYCGNSSFTQGAGFGRRAPCPNKPGADCTYMSGGLGVLRDVSGDDRYTTGVFGQGTGYWFGTGLLSDGAGNDQYDGKYYVQASAAHFALALFLDDQGDDLYNSHLATTATSIGVGHDFSVGWHIDSGGNDVYHAPGLSLGSGNANGIGVLINLGGDDIYRVRSEPTLGCGNLSGEVNKNAARRAIPTTGLFVDVGGSDTYDVVSKVLRGDQTIWNDVGEPPDSGLTSEHGAGVDRADGGVALP